MYRDSWVRPSGDMVRLAQQENFIQKLNDKGNDIHTLSNPSQAELIYKWHQEETENSKRVLSSLLVDKYGDQEDFSLKANDVEIKDSLKNKK